MSFLHFQERKHNAYFYDSEDKRDSEIVCFLNEGLAYGELCIYGTIHVSDSEYFNTITSRITNYEDNVKQRNLIVVDFIPFYIAALKRDLTPYKEVQQRLQTMIAEKPNLKVRYVGDATGYLFKNGYFDECIMIEAWWQNLHQPFITTLCLFDKSLMATPPFNTHKNTVIHNHDIAVNSY